MTGTTATPAELFASCEARGIRLRPSGDGGLTIDAPQAALTPDLVARLRTHKADLLVMLRTDKGAYGYTTPSNPEKYKGSVAVASVESHYGDAGQSQQPQDLAAAAAPRPRSAVPVAVEWPAAAADFCLLLTADDLPPAPFRLNAWTVVKDSAKMLRIMRADVLRGPSGPRAFYGTLQGDLEELRRFALAAHD
jgi:hypothetical protein